MMSGFGMLAGRIILWVNLYVSLIVYDSSTTDRTITAVIYDQVHKPSTQQH